MATATTEQLSQLSNQVSQLSDQIDILNGFMGTTKIPGPPGLPDRSVAKAIIDLEIYVQALLQDPPVLKSEAESTINNIIQEQRGSNY